jgi:hypothetical protein
MFSMIERVLNRRPGCVSCELPLVGSSQEKQPDPGLATRQRKFFWFKFNQTPVRLV